MHIVFCTCSLFRKLATLAGRARIHSHLYTSHLRLAILVPFPAPSLRNPYAPSCVTYAILISSPLRTAVSSAPYPLSLTNWLR